jgi:GNAT superfamily N-acetyltransferase
MGDIRLATSADRAAVVSPIVAAFADEPTVHWLFPDPDTFQANATAFFGYLFDRRVEAAEVWCRPGVGASLWEPPGGLDDGGDEHLARAAGVLPSAALDRMHLYHEVLDGRMPADPAWYLGVLAVHPSHQGTGLGRRLFDPVRIRADRDGVPIVLETAVEDNVGLYEYLGFRLLDTFVVPERGPRVWIMHRSPGAGAGW